LSDETRFRFAGNTPVAGSALFRRIAGVVGERAVEQFFRVLRRFRPVRERVTIGEYNDYVEKEHLARYHFAQRYCSGKVVADIACGTGYGSDILRQVAARVDSYDKELLCNNFTIDLERESWGKRYDVIVSFETLEHLGNPKFFLENAQMSASLLIVSTPVGEFKGYNPHHKQVWSLEEFRQLIEKGFTCSYFFQQGETIHADASSPIRFVIAVATPRDTCGD
jgi:2-polyprenyl-3-methyl-5-hydroxy-6-metoxy-1,4-benzoquinol methylase